jgi:hypothetical protein
MISVLIAALLVEIWVVSQNQIQPRQAEVGADEGAGKAEGGAQGAIRALTESFDKAAPGAVPEGWSRWAGPGTTVEVSGLKALSAPNGLALTGPSPGVARAWLARPQAADVQASAMVYLDTLIPAQVLIRGSRLDGAAASYYAVTAARGVEIQLLRCDAGKISSLAKIKSAKYFSGKWAQVTISAKGKNLRARLFNPDTKEWLDDKGQWKAASAWALEIADGEIAGGGLVGLGRSASYAGTVTFDDFQIGSPGNDALEAIAMPEKPAENRPPAKEAKAPAAKPNPKAPPTKPNVKGAPIKPNVKAPAEAAAPAPAPPPTDAKVPPASDLPRPTLPRHYSHIRIAMLAYSGNPMGALEDKLLKESIDLVVANDRYIDHIHAIAPDTPQLIYINTSNLYSDLLADWLRYADVNQVSREAAFYHAAQAKPFKGDSPSSRPVTWFWGVYRGSQPITDLTNSAHGNSGNLSLGGSGESFYLGHVDRFREVNFQLTSGANGGWSAELEYPSTVDGAGHPVTWTRLDILDDSTSGLARSGQFLFDPPSDWKTASVGSSLRLYFIRFRTTGGGTPPVARSILGRDHVQASGKTAGVIPAFDAKADLDQDGYLNSDEWDKHTPGKEARFFHESRMPTESYGQMRFCVNVSNPHFREWAVDFCSRELRRFPQVAGLFMDNSDGKTPVQAKEVIEPVSAYAADYGEMLLEISRAIAPHWILANTAGGQVRADPVVRQNPIYFEEFAIRPLSHHWSYFEDLAGTIGRRAALTTPPPLAVIDSHPQKGSPTDPRMQLATLAYYYLLADPDSTMLMFFGGFEPNTTWSRHWCTAVAHDVGRPTGKWSQFTTGADPATPGLTYRIYQRDYEKALVLYKPLSYARGSKASPSLDDETATSHDLKGTYRPLAADGSLGQPVTSISLRNGEGAILVKSK